MDSKTLRPCTFAAFGLLLLLTVGSSADDAPEPKAKPERTAAERKAAIIRSGPMTANSVALTFDDGPHPTLTPRLLEILKEDGSKATFFMLGSMVEKNPAIARAVVEAGHEVANHSWSHADLAKKSEEQIRDEIRKTQDIIEQATGVRPKLFRPPYGSVNDRVLRIAEEEGLDVVTWSVDPRDWDMKKSRDYVKKKVVDEGVPGAIVCMHDIHSRTVELVGELRTELKAKGLELAAAGELVEAEKIARASGKTSITATGTEMAIAPARPLIVPLSKTRWIRTKPTAVENIAPVEAAPTGGGQ